MSRYRIAKSITGDYMVEEHSADTVSLVADYTSRQQAQDHLARLRAEESNEALTAYVLPVRTLTLFTSESPVRIDGFTPPRTFGWLSDAFAAAAHEGLAYDPARTAAARKTTPGVEVWSDAHAL